MAKKKMVLPPVPQTKAAKAKIEKVLHEQKAGTLHMGTSGKMVPKGRRDIGIAIALNQARKTGKNKSA